MYPVDKYTLTIGIMILLSIVIPLLLVISDYLDRREAQKYTRNAISSVNRDIDRWATQTPEKPVKAVNKAGRALKNLFTGSYLLGDERECPPRAVFFCNFGGEYRENEGPYEAKYLNYQELINWNSKIAENPDLKSKTETKSRLLDDF